MNSKNSQASDLLRLLINLAEKTNLQRSDKCVDLSYLSICYTLNNRKNSYKNKKFKISASRNEVFELPNGTCYVSDVQDYFKYIFKKTWSSYWYTFNKNICK